MKGAEEKWLNIIREELTNHSPNYNAEDWKALEKRLPEPSGWFGMPFTITRWLKIIFAGVLCVVSILVMINLFNSTKQTNPECEKQCESPNLTISNKTEVKEQGNPDSPSKEAGIIYQKETSDEVMQEDVLPPVKQEVKNNVYRKNEEVSNKHDVEIAPLPERNTLISVQQKENAYTTGNTLISVKAKSNFTAKADSVYGGENEKTNSVDKISRDKRTKKNKIRFNKRSTFSEPVVRYPFYLGPIVSSGINFGMEGDNSGWFITGGITLQKYLSEKSAITFRTQIQFNSFQKTQIVAWYNQENNSTYFMSEDSIVLLPGYIDDILSNPTKEVELTMLCLDFPILYNYYAFMWKEHKLGISVGISNKYFLSAKLNENDVSISNKFCLAHSGTIGFSYQYGSKNNNLLEIEPYYSYPFRKVTDNDYSWSGFGINLTWLLNTSRSGN